MSSATRDFQREYLIIGAFVGLSRTSSLLVCLQWTGRSYLDRIVEAGYAHSIAEFVPGCIFDGVRG